MNLLGHVSESGTTLNVLHIWIGWNKSSWKLTGRNKRIFFQLTCVLLTQMILEKNNKKNQVSLRAHCPIWRYFVFLQ